MLGDLAFTPAPAATSARAITPAPATASACAIPVSPFWPANAVPPCWRARVAAREQTTCRGAWRRARAHVRVTRGPRPRREDGALGVKSKPSPSSRRARTMQLQSSVARGSVARGGARARLLQNRNRGEGEHGAATFVCDRAARCCLREREARLRRRPGPGARDRERGSEAPAQQQHGVGADQRRHGAVRGGAGGTFASSSGVKGAREAHGARPRARARVPVAAQRAGGVLLGVPRRVRVFEQARAPRERATRWPAATAGVRRRTSTRCCAMASSPVGTRIGCSGRT